MTTATSLAPSPTLARLTPSVGVPWQVARIQGAAPAIGEGAGIRNLAHQFGRSEMRSTRAWFWTDSRRSDFVATASAVRQAIVSALRESGLPFSGYLILPLVGLHRR